MHLFERTITLYINDIQCHFIYQRIKNELRIEQGGLGVKRDALFEELSIYHIKDESCV